MKTSRFRIKEETQERIGETVSDYHLFFFFLPPIDPSANAHNFVFLSLLPRYRKAWPGKKRTSSFVKLEPFLRPVEDKLLREPDRLLPSALSSRSFSPSYAISKQNRAIISGRSK